MVDATFDDGALGGGPDPALGRDQPGGERVAVDEVDIAGLKGCSRTPVTDQFQLPPGNPLTLGALAQSEIWATRFRRRRRPG